MKNPIEVLLENDHESLAQPLVELETELATPNLVRAFDLLDFFWARLAVHIRAENLHLFPALTNAPDSFFTGKGGLPTSEEAHNLLSRLRSDHDFFMKEIALMMKAAREIRAGHNEGLKESQDLRQRLTVIRKRLEAHNHLEEEQAYVWPTFLFDETTITHLCDQMRHELENLPPRFG